VFIRVLETVERMQDVRTEEQCTPLRNIMHYKGCVYLPDVESGPVRCEDWLRNRYVGTLGVCWFPVCQGWTDPAASSPHPPWMWVANGHSQDRYIPGYDTARLSALSEELHHWTLHPCSIIMCHNSGRSVGIARSRTKGRGVCLFVCLCHNSIGLLRGLWR
jgi:hypothetical protein